MNASKSPFSTPTTSVNIIELADHIETSSTPFPRQITSSALVSPDDIKRVAEKIRDPDPTPSRRPEEVVTSVNSFSIDDYEVGGVESTGPKLPAIWEEGQDTSDRKDTGSNLLTQTAVVSFENSCLQSVERAVREDAYSIVDSMSSASLLVSLAENESMEGDRYDTSDNEVDQKLDGDSVSLVSRGDDKIEDDHESMEDGTQRSLNEGKLDSCEEPDPLDRETEMSAHDRKHIMIQELKESSRFKFKKTGANAASNFADELAVVTGKKAAKFVPGNFDFASSLAKRVAEKDKYKTPNKKTDRKTLTPITSSPAHQSIGPHPSTFFADYL
ncbi:hypothetical protein HJC23_001486 [Cyclotella cryptica]|uniref:Uncharacterized protein n=1 Tax=Cyclotella cryptica TaxID=29204 RepID=A0ABD3P0W4_9STRA